MKIIIPTKGRAGVIRDKSLRLFPDAVLCVGESERDLYRKLSRNILVHPDDVVGIGPLRQWVLDHVEDPCVVMVDDDITHAYSQVGFHKRRIEDPDTCRAIVERMAILAQDAGVRVFSFQQAARPFTYANFRPFSGTPGSAGSSASTAARCDTTRRCCFGPTSTSACSR